ncbi:MAG: hypothetical protein JWO13_2876 [Acidobacteriales bacterium]|nr:hypothetical protein [Terriglobales bacterium]
MFRRRICCALLSMSILFLSSCTLCSQAKTSSWKNATGAEQHERLLWDAVKSKDWLNVESHLASSFVFVDSAGARDKAQRVKDLREMQVSELSLGDVNVTANGTGAIVTYTLTLKGVKAGNGTPSRVMSVWQQQKNGWVLVAMSETAAAK